MRHGPVTVLGRVDAGQDQAFAASGQIVLPSGEPALDEIDAEDLRVQQADVPILQQQPEAACLRGIEIGADAVLKATKVDGIYDSDPMRNPEARRFDRLDFDEVLARGLAVMDLAAICLCRDHGMPIVVFDMNDAGALGRLVRGEDVGTRVAAALPSA